MVETFHIDTWMAQKKRMLGISLHPLSVFILLWGACLPFIILMKGPINRFREHWQWNCRTWEHQLLQSILTEGGQFHFRRWIWDVLYGEGINLDHAHVFFFASAMGRAGREWCFVHDDNVPPFNKTFVYIFILRCSRLPCKRITFTIFFWKTASLALPPSGPMKPLQDGTPYFE